MLRTFQRGDRADVYLDFILRHMADILRHDVLSEQRDFYRYAASVVAI